MIIPHPLAIFAGGKSSRMGRDKALLPFGGYPTLTQYQLSRFQSVFKQIYISCKSREKFNFSADFIEDLDLYEDSAPYIGLISLFEQIAEDTVCVLSVDVPFFEAKHFQILLDHNSKACDAIVAKSPKGAQPLCAIYKRSTLPALKTLSEAKKYRFSFLFEHIDVTYVNFSDETIFTNLNTPDQYKQTLQQIQKPL
jgi:molybdopterin-guanine dinucleotide biosynthesis protein A